MLAVPVFSRSSRVAQRLNSAGVALPEPPSPSANYVPYVRAGGLIRLSGVAPSRAGRYVHRGKVGRDVTLADGYRAARLCALNALAVLEEACDGDLDRVSQIVGVRGFVNAATDFDAVPRVIDGASDLLVDAFGESIGRHARTSVGCATLPANVTVEIDVVAALRQGGLHDPRCARADCAAQLRYRWL